MIAKFEKPAACEGCPLHQLGKGFMGIVDGTGRNGVLLVGESLGEHEVEEGKAFVGPAGFTLGSRVLQRGGLAREDFKIANVVWCQPPGNKLFDDRGRWAVYAEEAMAHCAPYLDAVIREMRPRCIVPLGEVALRRVLALRGISACRGYPFWSERYATWVVPTFHPSYLMRGKQSLTRVTTADIKKAVRIAAEGFAFDVIDAICDPTPERFAAWIDGYDHALAREPELGLAFDIETPYKRGKDEDDLDVGEDPTFTILRISFAYGPDGGVTVPWAAPWLPGIARLLASPGLKLCWNGRIYDVPRIRANGVVVNGLIRDSMIAWHTLNSDLPKKLGFVTPSYWAGARMWKHLAESEPEYYSAVDPVANWICDRGIVRDLRATGMWEVYERQVQMLDRVLDRMTTAGVLVDVAARDALRTTVQARMAEITDRMQEVVPVEIRKMKVYAPGKSPKVVPLRADVIEVEGVKRENTCTACGAHPVTKPHVTRKTVELGGEQAA